MTARGRQTRAGLMRGSGINYSFSKQRSVFGLKFEFEAHPRRASPHLPAPHTSSSLSQLKNSNVLWTSDLTVFHCNVQCSPFITLVQPQYRKYTQSLQASCKFKSKAQSPRSPYYYPIAHSGTSAHWPNLLNVCPCSSTRTLHHGTTPLVAPHSSALVQCITALFPSRLSPLVTPPSSLPPQLLWC